MLQDIRSIIVAFYREFFESIFFNKLLRFHEIEKEAEKFAKYSIDDIRDFKARLMIIKKILDDKFDFKSLLGALENIKYKDKVKKQ